MMAFILATDFDFIACMSKMTFFGSFFLRQWRFWNMIIITITTTTPTTIIMMMMMMMMMMTTKGQLSY